MEQKDLKEYFSQLEIKMKNTDWEKLRKDHYEEELQNINNFSYWYPKIKNCGIKMVNALIIQIPYEEWKAFQEAEEDKNAEIRCIEYLKYVLNMNKVKRGMYNIKNGTFSNKFDASTCNVSLEEIPQSFIKIQNASWFFDTGGTTELIIRDYIPINFNEELTIYNGLPLRPEFRIFVDFNENKVLYSVNYWDFDYCYPHLYNANDKLVFEYMRDTLNAEYETKKDYVKALANKLIIYNNNQENKLTGQWSVDFMLFENEYYLIDMAVAQQSAYWNVNNIDK